MTAAESGTIPSPGLPSLSERYFDSCARSNTMASGSLSGLSATTTFDRVAGEAAGICGTIQIPASKVIKELVENFILALLLLRLNLISSCFPGKFEDLVRNGESDPRCWNALSRSRG